MLTTLYVDVGPELLKLAYESLFHLKRIKLGDENPAIAEIVGGSLAALAEGILSIRDKLISYEYEEPATASTMIWEVPRLWRTHREAPFYRSCLPIDKAIQEDPPDEGKAGGRLILPGDLGRSSADTYEEIPRRTSRRPF